MNRLGLTLFLLTSLSGCDSKENCIANCEDGSSSGSEGTADLPTGGGGLSCEEAIVTAEQFIEAHRSCETMLDCEVSDRNVCFPPAVIPGAVALSLDGNPQEEEWAEIREGLADACPCEDPVSAGSFCNAAKECEAFNAETGRDQFCGSLLGDVETFLAANTGCTIDSDCMAVDSSCYVDDCSITALSVEADTLEWARLDDAGFGCSFGDAPGAGCNYVGECDAGVECSDQGVCVAVP
ncbi:MAG: hypothetical protein ACRBN8_04950 [Nannocystales bacterium]